MSLSPPLYRLPQGGRNSAAGIYVGSVLVVVSVTVLALWGATQYVAEALRFHPALGAPLLRLPPVLRPAVFVLSLFGGVAACLCLLSARYRSRSWLLGTLSLVLYGLSRGPLYKPHQFFYWWWTFGGAPSTASLWRTAVWIVSLPTHLALLVGVLLALHRGRHLGGASDLHGSAHWATARDIAAAQLLHNTDGVYVGAWEHNGKLYYLRHHGPQHVLGFAPARSGKGVGLVLPTLLSWPHSVLVNDIKAENWALTAGWRQRELGSCCLKFDPTANDGSSARYNPLFEIRPWPLDVRDAQLLAEMLIDPDGDGTRGHWDRHWDMTAADLLTGVILHVLYAEREKTLRGCLHLLADPSRSIENLLTDMLQATHDPELQLGWIDPVTQQPVATHPVIAGAARALLNKSENERSSVVSSAIKYLNLFRDPVVAANTETCDFRVTDLIYADKPISLYLTTPSSDITRVRPLLRLILDHCGRRLTEHLEGAGTHTRPAADSPQRRPLLLMLDEFATLGRLEFLQTALSYLPGYGIRAFLILQDLSQLYHAYGHDDAIMSNCHVRVAYAPNKIETAKLVSEMAGQQTVHKETRTYTGGRLSPVLWHVIAAEQESQRPLLTPDEVMRLSDETALIFVAGHPPIYGRKIRHYLDPVFAARAEILPPATSDRIVHDFSHWTNRIAAPRSAAPQSEDDETVADDCPAAQHEDVPVAAETDGEELL